MRSGKKALPKEWISALFKRFQARYLNKFTSGIEGIEALAVEEWSKELAGLTGKQIKHGLKSWDQDWPPSAPEFRKACLGDDKHWMYKTIEANKHLKRLPVKKASDEVYRAEIEKLRRLGIRI